MEKKDPALAEKLEKSRKDPTQRASLSTTSERLSFEQRRSRRPGRASGSSATSSKERRQLRGTSSASSRLTSTRPKRSRDIDQLLSSRRNRTGSSSKRLGVSASERTRRAARTTDIASLTSRYRPGHSLLDTSVIIDFGTRYTKAGFACDSCPRNFVKTNLLTIFPRKSKPAPHTLFKHLDPISPENTYITQTPLSKETWQTSLQSFLSNLLLITCEWDHTSLNLQVKTSDRKVYICENPFWPSFIKEGIQKALFHLEIPGICFLNSLTCPVFCTGGDTAFVVDIGYSTVKIQGLVGGHICLETQRSVPIGMYSMIHEFKVCMKELTKGGLDCDKLNIEEEALESCLSRICFFESKTKSSKARDVEYELPLDGGKIFVNIPGKARHAPGEALFGKNSFGVNIAEFICETLMKAPTDVRCRLAANILVVGGVGHLPGLEKRLGQEILESVASNPAFLDLKKPASLTAFLKTPFHFNSRTWIGACISVGLKPFNHKRVFIERSLQRSESLEKGGTEIRDEFS